MSVLVYSPTAPSDDVVQQQIRVSLSRQNIVFFAQHYLRDSDGEPFAFKDFHIEMLEVCASDEEKVLFLEPAAHGKTTLVARIYPIWLVCCFPNSRIKLGGKNADDAQSRLLAIKNELETNEALITDFGSFKSSVWKEDQINVAQRTIIDQEPTIYAFGSESSLIGKRGTHLILDDVVSEQNSGDNVESDTRRRVAVNYHTTWKKIGYPKRRLRIRWVNTVVHMQDAVHEMANVSGHFPEDRRSRWRSDQGYLVLHREALNEQTGEALWPEAHSAEELYAERAQDITSFNKRMQNRTIDPSLLSFQRSWFTGDASLTPPAPGCFDYDRKLGEMPKELREVTQSAGYDPNSGLTKQAKFCGWVRLGFDRKAPRGERVLYVIDIQRFRKTLPDQERFIVEQVTAHHPALTKIENNVQQQWILQLAGIEALVKSGYRVEGHHTSTKNTPGKPSAETGIPNLAGMVRAGLIRLPYGDAASKQMSELLVGEFLDYPEGATSDLLMALWFAILAADDVAAKTGMHFLGVPLPGWANRGLEREAIDRLYPTMEVR